MQGGTKRPLLLLRSRLNTSRTTWLASCSLSLPIRRNYQGHAAGAEIVDTSGYADFRSDTATRPTPGMRRAMAEAPVGDDVFREDPTIARLEAKMRELTGKEAALFCCTGTMSNQLGLRCALSALTSVVCDKRAHIYRYEAGGVAYHAQAQVVPIDPHPDHGHITAEQVEDNIFPQDDHYAVTKVVSLENTLAGAVFPIDEIRRIGDVAKKHGLHMHLDGARLWNANVASGVSLKEYGDCFDTLSICLSKGLGAPVGSVLVGKTELINKARHYRKLWGGGWRQGGVLAAAGLYAIENQWERMKEDHDIAAYLGKELERMGFQLAQPVQTNIVMVDSDRLGLPWEPIAAKLKEKGILVAALSKYRARFVTHIQTPRSDVDKLLSELPSILRLLKDEQQHH
ncbi:Threonine aldolase [Balamuthia mandrillaris]